MPLGDGHGPDAPKHPTQRFLTSPELSERIAKYAADHEAFIAELVSPAAQYEAAMLALENGARVLARLSKTALPFVAPQASVITASLEAIAESVRKEA